ncbi:helix-turn-helix transcriptional regulator [Sporolactobacillus kofuensis]|uniref:Helix-turn-helix transcriptional regulator n=1 Tax=Sporolactobacillus kofuensis TaxID=269672 RepID=A0ABW1WBP1_9BACL|nr:helix-turn-helix transcriptional regulator [Sporolactobacillus kofuensis]MCO7175578.1 helix-turn-helix domain-containing protein [Sporolactobacillus kofuensis]
MALRKGRCRLKDQLNISQAEFARKMEVTESTVSHWITGRQKMNLDNAVLASRILHCKVEDLYEWIEYKRL